jgi:hypothetical protein
MITDPVAGAVRTREYPRSVHGSGPYAGTITSVGLRIPQATRPFPPAAGSPARPRIAAIKLTLAETARLSRPARQHATGLITRTRLAFHLRWSAWRRRHQGRARRHHFSTRLLAAAAA